VSELSLHLAESCAIEAVTCPNATAGCNESVMRKDAALHATETCWYRPVLCAHCHDPFEARALLGHEGGCPEAQVECPCPGCKEWMMRADVEQHVASSGAVHLQLALTVVAETGREMVELQKKAVDERVDERAASLVLKHQLKGEQKKAGVLRSVIEAQKEEITGLREGLHLRQARLGVFVWTMPIVAWSPQASDSFTFREEGEGWGGRVSGCCSSQLNTDTTTPFTHFMGFSLTKGPVCDMLMK